MKRLELVFIGLSITSSWGNGHATTYRALIRELARQGHRVTFLECDTPWYAANRDLPEPAWCATHLYRSQDELQARFAGLVRSADAVIVGSFVPEGIAVGEWVQETASGLVAFYDIDTPVTLANLNDGEWYLNAALIPRYDLYLSFTGGPTLLRLERELGAPLARALYCSADPEQYRPEPVEPLWDLGYLGTYSTDRQAKLEALLTTPARRLPQARFVVAGAQYPDDLAWPENVERIQHLPPAEHRHFYARQRFTLNVTRADMTAAGWSPSVRLFEAAACGTPIISDWWDGLDSLFVPGEDILIGEDWDDVVRTLSLMPEAQRRAIGAAARRRVLAGHTAAHRARELVAHLRDAAALKERRRSRSVAAAGGAPA